MTFGTPLAATNFAPFTQCQLIADPGLFYPSTMMGIRDVNVFPLYGQEKIGGPLDVPLFPVNGIPLLLGTIGTDVAQTGTAAGTAKNGTLASAVVGATTLTYTVTNGTPAPITGDFLQIGPAVATFGASAIFAVGAPNVYQVVKITNVTGAGPYTLTIAAPGLSYAVAPTAVAQAVVAPFYHNNAPANVLPSFTIEKNLGNSQSEQYAGCRVNKASLKLPTTNSEASASYDIMGQSVAILDTPTGITVDPTNPWVFAEGSVSLFGQTPAITNVDMTVDNSLKDTFTVQNSHLAQFITATSRKVSGQLTSVWHSLDDTTWGYFKQAMPSLASGGTPVQGALSMTLTHPSSGGILFMSFPACNFAKIGDDLKVGDVVLQTLDVTAAYSISSGYSLQCYVANSAYLPY